MISAMQKETFPKIEVLPHPVEVVLDWAERAWKFGRSVIKNTNVQFEDTGAVPMLDAHLDEGR